MAKKKKNAFIGILYQMIEVGLTRKAERMGLSAGLITGRLLRSAREKRPKMCWETTSDLTNIHPF